MGFFGDQWGAISWDAANLGSPVPNSVQDATQATWGTGMGASAGHPALPALWWLGLVIGLILLRVLDNVR